MRSPQLFAALYIAGVISHATPATAQDVAAAEALFTRGVADMIAGRHETGCPAIAESYRLDPRPGTLFTLAECEAGQGRIATSFAHYSDYVALYDRMAPDQKSKHRERHDIAESQRAALEPQVPKLTLVAPVTAMVKRDGVDLAAPSLNVPLPLDPGEHVITIEIPGGHVREVRIEIGRGENKRIDLSQSTATPAPPPPTARPKPPPPRTGSAPAEGSSARRVIAYTAGGIGIAALALGGVTGALAFGKRSTIESHCDDQKMCDHEGKVAADDTQALGLVSTIGFGAGTAALGAAVVLLLTEPSKAKALSADRARGVHAALIALGPSGAVVGTEGAW